MPSSSFYDIQLDKIIDKWNICLFVEKTVWLYLQI